MNAYYVRLMLEYAKGDMSFLRCFRVVRVIRVIRVITMIGVLTPLIALITPPARKHRREAC